MSRLEFIFQSCVTQEVSAQALVINNAVPMNLTILIKTLKNPN